MCSDKIVNFVSEPIVAGRLAPKSLSCASRDVSESRDPMLVGSCVRLFSYTVKVVSFVRDPIVDGIPELKELR